jgi:hypothetical protein
MMDWIEGVKQLGFPVFIVIAGGFGLWRTIQWGAANVIKPLIDRHIKFLDRLESFMSDTGTALQKLSDNQESLAQLVAKLMDQ